MIINIKQRKLKIEPRIKLNYNIYTVLSKSLGFEMREFRSLFSRTFIESSLESSREISRYLERYFAETKSDISPHFWGRNEISC